MVRFFFFLYIFFLFAHSLIPFVGKRPKRNGRPENSYISISLLPLKIYKLKKSFHKWPKTKVVIPFCIDAEFDISGTAGPCHILHPPFKHRNLCKFSQDDIKGRGRGGGGNIYHSDCLFFVFCEHFHNYFVSMNLPIAS